MNVFNLRRILLLLMAFILMAACSSLLQRPEPPRVDLAGLEVLEVGLLEQRYLLKLRLQNTNTQDLTIKGLDYEVFINDRPFAHGVSRRSVTIPAFGEDVIEVEVNSNLTRLYEQLRSLQEGSHQNLNYRIFGGLKLNNWPTKNSLRVPWNCQLKSGSKQLVQESASSSPISLVMIAPGGVVPRYMGPAMLPRRALPGTILPHRNSHQTYALLHQLLR